MKVEIALDVKAELGEGPLWDDRRNVLLFVDIMRGHVHEFDPAAKSDRVVKLGRPVGCVALTEAGDWIAGCAGGFYRVSPITGQVKLIAGVEANRADNRINDGYVDARGRFWAGTMGMSGKKEQGTLYRLDPDLRVRRVFGPVSISNGLDWSPDNKIFYYIDLPTSRIDQFDFDLATGEIKNRRTFVEFPVEVGYPDGLVVDAEGFVWVGLWEGGSIHRYAPDGRLDVIVPIPASQTTKCAFGGKDRSDLYVTTAWIGLDPAARTEQTHAGSLFRLKPGVKGKKVHRFAG